MGGRAAARAGWAESSLHDPARKSPILSDVLDARDLDPLSWCIDEPLPSRWGRCKTRVFDLTVALIALFVFLPAFAVIALAVKSTSPGPVLFRQRRVGRSGKPFSCLKFRTMTRDADSQLPHILRDDPALSAEFRGSFKLRQDPRVTRVGRFLRAISLDELPQLFNVIWGQMSIVGPRPIVDAERSRYGNHLPLVLRVKPGMTGLWQVSGRNNLPYHERVALDARYAQNPRLSVNVLICLRTVGLLFSRDGAY